MKLVCIGSGNVATHLSIALKTMGVDIAQVWGRDLQKAGILAALTGAQAIHSWSEVDKNADFYLIAVKDDAISTVAGKLQDVNGIVIHTSGTSSLEVLGNAGRGRGVLYPLQTFSKSKVLSIAEVPFCIEGSDLQVAERLAALAGLISVKVYPVDTRQRKALHLAAVYVCNFSNQLYAIGQELIEKEGLSFDLLRPLIQETAAKIQDTIPAEVQTGPAVRRDEVTMQLQLDLLQGNDELQQLYELFSKRIQRTS